MRRVRSALRCITIAVLAYPLSAQSPTPTSAPTAYPYTFSNFIWWSNDDLRAALKKRLPALGDELVPYSALDEKVRRALAELLKTKGIHADVMTLEVGSQPKPPSQPAGNIAIGVQAPSILLPNPAKPAIVYEVLSPPEIKVGTVTVQGAPADLDASIRQATTYLSGSDYKSNFAVTNFRITSIFQQTSYLSETEEIVAGTYEKQDDGHYLVPLTIKINAGPQYHIGTIKADGGPLFKGVDLTKYIPAHSGDIVVPGMCSRLAYSLRDAYHRAGYAYAEVHTDPILDIDHALASYNITVDPGPLYHFRNLTILHLDEARQQTVRSLLDMKPGDVYNSVLAMTLEGKLQRDPAFGHTRLTYAAKADETDHVVDITLDFFKE